MRGKQNIISFLLILSNLLEAFPWQLSWQRIFLQCRRPWVNSWVGKVCWRRDRLPSPVLLGFPCGSALFYTWVIIQYYFILLLKLLPIWPLGSLLVDSWVPLTYPIILFLFEYFLIFWHFILLQVHVIYF